MFSHDRLDQRRDPLEDLESLVRFGSIFEVLNGCDPDIGAAIQVRHWAEDGVRDLVSVH